AAPHAATEVSEFLFADGPDKDIKAFRIAFASGYEIIALSSRPRSLRGRQGYVILDEFAFHDDATGLLKAAMALLIWGGKVLVISTHNGVDNPFNELITEVRAGKRPGAVVRCTFDQALEEGLYERVCLMTGKAWSPEAEAEWRTGIRKFYGADAAEELDCVPAQGSGVYLTRTLIEACAVLTGPVLRLHCPPGFDLRPEPERRSYVDAWLEQNVDPQLKVLDKNLRHAFGQDFARSGDASVYVPLTIERDLRRTVPFAIEMRNVPYEQQKQIVFHATEGLPRFSHGKLDATGNGNYLAEVCQQKFGAERIEKVVLSQAWYISNMPPLKAAFEDRDLLILKDADHADDLRQIKLVKGVPMVPPGVETKGTDGLKRHGDFAPALCLAFAATRADPSEIDYRPVARHTALGRAEGTIEDDFDRRYGGAFSNSDAARVGLRRSKGAW
ncbi:terminase large subunit domain-containing protein, partial [Brevundimonas sp.]|uniref:terminase large subunit domain-containing protein n=1 Tax=Brevundimonas sp. TaxID=1871086 RepID=UPI003517BCD7